VPLEAITAANFRTPLAIAGTLVALEADGA
jgi:hypothetical protein